MGQGFSAKSQFELALERYDETLASIDIKDDSWKNLWYAKADVLEKLGKKDDAAKAFTEIYKIDVGFRDVGKRLEKLQKK